VSNFGSKVCSVGVDCFFVAFKQDSKRVFSFGAEKLSRGSTLKNGK